MRRCLRLLFLAILILLLVIQTGVCSKPKKQGSERYYEATFTITAYCYGTRTATGTVPKMGTVAADPYVLPYGTKVHIPGYGKGTIEDCGGAIVGNRLDIWLPTENECYAWGVREKTVRVYY